MANPEGGSDGVSEPEVDDIKIEHHPSAGFDTKIFGFDEYCGHTPNTQVGTDLSTMFGDQPWQPFRTKFDFEVAELVLETHMNERQIEKLISLFHQVVREPDTFTISNANDLSYAWDLASKIRAHQVSLILIKY